MLTTRRWSLPLLVALAGCAGPDFSERAELENGSRRIDVRVSGAEEREQEDAVADIGPDGTVVAAWTAREENGTPGVFARRFDSLGRALGADTQVNLFTESAQRDPSVSIGPGGEVWMTWATWGQDGQGQGVAARRLDASLRTGSDEIGVNETRDGDQSSPVIAAGRDGAMVAWVTPVGLTGSQIRVRLLGADGAPATAEQVIGSPGDRDRDSVPTVTALPEGFIVAWARSDVDGNLAGVLAQRIARDGSLIDSAPIVVADGDAIEPTVAADAHGRFVIAWHNCVQGVYRASARWFGADGLAGPVEAIAPSLPGEMTAAAAAMDANGRTVMAFNYQATPTSTMSVYAGEFDPSGGQVSGEFQLSEAEEEEAAQRLDVSTGARRIAIGPRGQIAAAWMAAGTEGEADESEAELTLLVPRTLASELADGPAPVVIASAEHHGDATPEPHRPPVWDPKWRPQPPLGGIAGDGPDFGFEAVPGTGWTPPDCEMAVAKDYLVFIVNGQIRIMDKAGNTTFSQLIEGASGFWGAQGAGGFVFDPEAHYDPLSDRVWVMCCERTNGQSFFNLAVSDDGNPNGTWFKYRFNVTALGQDDIDSPELAVDNQAVYLTSDHFGPDKFLVIMLPKAPLMAGQAAPPFTNIVINGSQSYGVPMTWDAGAPAQYMIQSTELSVNNTVIFHAIKDPLGTPTRVTQTISVPEYRFPIAPTQKGTGSKPTLFEPRFWSCIYYNGSLWAVHHISKVPGNNNTIVRWYEFSMNGWPDSGQIPALKQSGELDPGAGLFAFFPSISADAQGNAAITFARSGAAEYIGMWRAIRRWNDAPGTFRAETIVKLSAAPHTSGRWGDYSKTQPDLFKPCTFWGHHEWTPNGSWRTWCGQYKNYAKSDLNEDCVLDIDDFIKFQELFGLGDMKADFNGDGVLDVDDFIEYQVAFGLGL